MTTHTAKHAGINNGMACISAAEIVYQCCRCEYVHWRYCFAKGLTMKTVTSFISMDIKMNATNENSDTFIQPLFNLGQWAYDFCA